MLASANDLPRARWGLSPFFPIRTRLFLRQVESLPADSRCTDILFLHGHPVRRIEVVAILVGLDLRDRFAELALDDGTATLRAVRWENGPERPGGHLKIGDWLVVHAHASRFKQERQLTVLYADGVRDENYPALWMAETLAIQKEMARGAWRVGRADPVPPLETDDVSVVLGAAHGRTELATFLRAPSNLPLFLLFYLWQRRALCVATSDLLLDANVLAATRWFHGDSPVDCTEALSLAVSAMAREGLVRADAAGALVMPAVGDATWQFVLDAIGADPEGVSDATIGRRRGPAGAEPVPSSILQLMVREMLKEGLVYEAGHGVYKGLE